MMWIWGSAKAILEQVLIEGKNIVTDMFYLKYDYHDWASFFRQFSQIT